jgi:hypothetical protein
LHTKYIDLARTAACYRDEPQHDTPRLTLLGRCAHAAPPIALFVFVLLKVWGVI